VPLGLVFFQNLFDLQIQRPVIKRKPLRQVFMYGRFADAVFLGRRPDGGSVLYDVNGQFTGPLLNISFDRSPLPDCSSAIHIYVGKAGKSTLPADFSGRRHKKAGFLRNAPGQEPRREIAV